MRKVHAYLLTMLLAAAVGLGQESRATLAGTVTDPQAAIIPAAKVEARNVATNVITTGVTSEAGVYSIPFLNPGTYNVSVSSGGFKTAVRNNVELRVGDRVQLDFSLELGQSTETISVHAEAPLLETGTASQGTMLSNQVVSDIPLLGRNPFSLMQFTAGAVHPPALASGAERPFDNGGMDNYSINGGRTFTNEFLLDGAPNTNSENGQPSNLTFVPSPDAVNEFKMQTNVYDAEYGRTGGGVVNVGLKSGANSYHGAAYWYVRNNIFNANTFQANKAGAPLSSFHWNQPGAMLSGPIRLPKIYDGRNRTFFMYNWEEIRSTVPRPSTGIFPTDLERGGDFSQTLVNGRPITLYDPLTTIQVSAGVYQRTPFPNSQIPANRTNPVALKLLEYLPKPSQTGAARGIVNLTVAPNATTDAYDAHTFRLDQNIDERNKFFFSFVRGNRHESGGLGGGRAAYAAIGHPEAAPTYNHWRINHGATFNYTSAFSPSFLSTTRVSFNRHQFAIAEAIDGYNPAPLGWPSSTLAQLQRLSFPDISVTNYGFTGNTANNFLGGSNFAGSIYNFSNTWSVAETLTKVVSSHSLKFGGEFRTMLNNYSTLARSATLQFTPGFTQANPLVSDPSSGDAFASFLLGYPDSSSTGTSYNNLPAWGNHYYVAFFHDDWRVSGKLTLNLGLRWDYESPQSDRYNRLVRGFDPNGTATLSNGVQIKGGLLLADDANRLPYKRDLNNFQPRIGVAYKFSSKMVFRGGYGMSYLPTANFPATTGFSITTPVVASTDGNLTPTQLSNGQGLLSNPFPSGVLLPPGRSLGLLTNLGQSITYPYADRTIPYVHTFSAGIQYELPFRAVMDVSYIGSRTRELQTSKILGIPASQYLAEGANLQTSVPSPFAGVVPGTPINAATIPRSQALLPYPQFTTVTEAFRSNGKTWYDSLQLRFEKRFSAGLTALVTYTFSKNMTQNIYLNSPQDAVGQLARIIDANDQPHVLNLVSTYRLPFFNQSTRIKRALLGGWEIAGTATWQSGVPYAMGNTTAGAQTGFFSTGVDPSIPNPTRNRAFNTCTLGLSGQRINCASASEPAAWMIQPAFTLNALSQRLGNLRTSRPMQTNLSMFKAFQVAERLRAEFRAESFNTTNTPWFGAPTTTATASTFGVVPESQINDPRSIQLALRLTF